MDILVVVVNIGEVHNQCVSTLSEQASVDTALKHVAQC